MVKGGCAGLTDGWSVGIAGEGGGDGEAKCCWRDAKILLTDGRVGFGGSIGRRKPHGISQGIGGTVWQGMGPHGRWCWVPLDGALYPVPDSYHVRMSFLVAFSRASYRMYSLAPSVASRRASAAVSNTISMHRSIQACRQLGWPGAPYSDNGRQFTGSVFSKTVKES